MENQVNICQWCNNEILGRTRIFCGECFQKMREMVTEGKNRIRNPTVEQQCVLCNEHEGRIIYQFNEKDSQKEGVYICDLCIEEEMSKEEKTWRIR